MHKVILQTRASGNHGWVSTSQLLGPDVRESLKKETRAGRELSRTDLRGSCVGHRLWLRLSQTSISLTHESAIHKATQQTRASENHGWTSTSQLLSPDVRESLKKETRAGRELSRTDLRGSCVGHRLWLRLSQTSRFLIHEAAMHKAILQTRASENHGWVSTSQLLGPDVRESLKKETRAGRKLQPP